MNFKLRLQKIIHYEFWPFWFFYSPLTPLYLYYSIKSKSLTYFTAANPGINWGGLLGYSKSQITQNIDPNFLPKSELISLETLKTLKPNYPIILKPDEGERGIGVEKIENEEQKREYLANCKYKQLIVQEFIELDYEFGLFYARLPTEENGKILSITSKEFLNIWGDGKTTLWDLIKNQPRAKNRLAYFRKKYKNQTDLVPPKGERTVLEPIGNHNRGTIFLDSSHLINPKLEIVLDKIAKQIDGFFYGRFDVKAKNEGELKKGNFVIIEANGVNSEPTHIYHPKKFTLLQAYKEVVRHLEVQYQISTQNHKNGIPYSKTKDLAKAIFKKHIFGYS